MALPNLKFDEQDKDEFKDSLPGEKVSTLESGIYPVKISMAYLDESATGAWCVKLTLKDSEFEIFEQTFSLYVTSGKAKGCKNYYEDRDGNRRKLPSLALMDQITQVTLGKNLGELEPEQKIIQVWDMETKGKVDAKKYVYMELIGKEFQAGILKIEDNKRVKTDSGWESSNEKRIFNDLDKAFNSDGLTVAEIRSGDMSPAFIHDYAKKYTGVTVNKFKSVGENPKIPPKPGKPAVPATDKPLFE